MGNACYVIRRLFHVLGTDAIKTAYCSYFLSLIKYGIICGGNSTNVTKEFLQQKRMRRITMEVSIRCSCREEVEILPVPCEYIFSVMAFTVKNLDNFQTNSVVHRMYTRAKHQLHRHTVKFSHIQKGLFYSSIKKFNSLRPPPPPPPPFPLSPTNPKHKIQTKINSPHTT
jgi:hypothetical protein